MTIDKSALKALAETAPKGPWFGPEYESGTSYVFDADLGSLLRYESIDTEQDACLRYVAAANPAAILELLAEIEGLHAQHARDSGELRKLCSARDSARRQRDQLKAENDRLREDLILAKQSPLYSTRRDAGRYRWLRDHHIGDDPESINLEPASKPGLSAAIDAAAGKDESI